MSISVQWPEDLDPQGLAGKFFTAAATVLTPEGDVDTEATSTYWNYLVSNGACGLAVCAHTGYGDHLKLPQKLTLVDLAEQLSVPLIVGLLGGSQSALEFASQLPGRSVAALLVPNFIDLSDDAYMDLLDTLWEASRKPILLFDLYVSSYSQPRFERALRHPAVVGAKMALLDDAVKCQERIWFTRSIGKIAFSGEDRMLAASLLWGAQSLLIGTGAVFPQVTSAVFHAISEGSITQVREAADLLDQFAAQTFYKPFEGYIPRLIYLAQLHGVIPSTHPDDAFYPALDELERQRLQLLYTQLQQATTGVHLPGHV